MTLTEEFQKLWKNQEIDEKLLVPLFTWCSNKESNIEMCQDINRCFFYVDKKVLARKLSMNNKLRHFTSYPKYSKEDESVEFFYRDLGTKFKWTKSETFINMDVLDMERMKIIISREFGYDKKEIKLLKKVL